MIGRPQVKFDIQISENIKILLKCLCVSETMQLKKWMSNLTLDTGLYKGPIISSHPAFITCFSLCEIHFLILAYHFSDFIIIPRWHNIIGPWMVYFFSLYIKVLNVCYIAVCYMQYIVNTVVWLVCVMTKITINIYAMCPPYTSMRTNRYKGKYMFPGQLSG